MLTVTIGWYKRSGNGIIRVDITADGGKSWTSANLQHHELGQKRGR
jgi:Mo-co oxidoreductase dimerisation domain